MLFSPLEQFSVVRHSPAYLPGSNATLYGAIALCLVFGSVLGVYKTSGNRMVPSSWQWAGESLGTFYLTVVKQQAGVQGEFLAPLLGSLFFYILSSNLLGLIPFSFAVTGQLAVTLTLALSINLGLLILGIQKNGLEFFKLFVPSGVPTGVLPLIILIEVVSYLLRTFSLSVRLFANIMAGHALLHILTSFVVRFVLSQFYALRILPAALVVAVTFLEFAIAFLQAYVFLVLCSIYLNDSLHPSHLFASFLRWARKESNLRCPLIKRLFYR